MAGGTAGLGRVMVGVSGGTPVHAWEAKMGLVPFANEILVWFCSSRRIYASCDIVFPLNMPAKKTGVPKLKITYEGPELFHR